MGHVILLSRRKCIPKDSPDKGGILARHLTRPTVTAAPSYRHPRLHRRRLPLPGLLDRAPRLPLLQVETLKLVSNDFSTVVMSRSRSSVSVTSSSVSLVKPSSSGDEDTSSYSEASGEEVALVWPKYHFENFKQYFKIKYLLLNLLFFLEDFFIKEIGKRHLHV